MNASALITAREVSILDPCCSDVEINGQWYLIPNALLDRIIELEKNNKELKRSACTGSFDGIMAQAMLKDE